MKYDPARIGALHAYRDAYGRIAPSLAEAERAAELPDLPEETRAYCEARRDTLRRICAGLELRAAEHAR